MAVAVERERIRTCLKDFDFQRLFVEELGWDRYRAVLTVPADGREWTLRPVAQKRGFAVLCCDPDASGGIPDHATRRKIETQAEKQVHEHLIIYADRDQTMQVWQWVRRQKGAPAASRELRYFVGQSGEALVQRLRQFAVAIEDEEALTILDVASKVAGALDVDRVTRRFYDGFKTEHEKFLGAITGIADGEQRAWYASLMLNRLMFTYFIQYQGFLAGDEHYLRNRLALVRARYGADQFDRFYREFLLTFFHHGLGRPVATRSPEVAALIGDIPYVNGGLFEVHTIEAANPAIAIPDAAFERVFDFFDDWHWHLDTEHADAAHPDNEINPDVLGYIFEKYINQKQMGAYYTKEDITGYIGRNTIVPYLLDAAKKDCAVAFAPDGEVWRLLRDDPDAYIYEAVRRGVDEPLPADIAAGLDDVAQRGGWNRPAPQPYALPTETWREHVARRTRCLDLRAKLAAGEVTQVNDLITYNLDIERFALDAIERCEGPELLRAFWKALTSVTILDPTCGSGAFLFAALNILEPLYEACLDRMRAFVAGFDRTGEARKGEDFRAVLAQVAEHPNRRYYVLKTIIVNNLYGVDIMEEACEIAKLRLFLKLVAQVEDARRLEPLPDIDFNIRAGNTLVGFATLDAVREAMQYGPRGQMKMLSAEDEETLRRIDENAENAAAAFAQFRAQQTTHGGTVTPTDKAALRKRLDALRAELDRYLAREYGVDPDDLFAYGPWRKSHQPFHWFVEFYGIVHSRGGFDVIIGNPPYVAKRYIGYSVQDTYGDYFPDLYADVLVRSTHIAMRSGRMGMIVPLSLMFSEDFGGLRNAVCAVGEGWFSSFDNIPAALFSGVSQRCTIWLGARGIQRRTYVGPLTRWRATYRPVLVDNIAYVVCINRDVERAGIPRVASGRQCAVISKWQDYNKLSRRSFVPGLRSGPSKLGYSQAARNFASFFLEDPPCLDEVSLKEVGASKIGYVTLPNIQASYAALAITSGELFLWYWLVRGDGFDVTGWLVTDFLAALNAVPDRALSLLSNLGSLLHARRNEALVFKKNAGKYVGNYNYRPLALLTRRADLLLQATLDIAEASTSDITERVRTVLSINEHAGEKAIPAEIKALYPPLPYDVVRERSIIAEVDRVLADHYGFTAEELDFIINYDIKYRMGAENGEE
jgi:hypothetical protein